MTPRLILKLDFNTNFSAFVIYLFEEFPGCTEDALSKLNKLDLKKDIAKIKQKETLEDDKLFLKALSKNPFALKKKVSSELFEQIYVNYENYYSKNKKTFLNRMRLVTSELNDERIKQILSTIESKTKIAFKSKRINVWLVDIYYLVKENSIEGTTTKEGIYIGLPDKQLNLFYSILIHELIHYNLQGRYSENQEEVVAQALGLIISKIILGKIPRQSIIIAKKRINDITRKDLFGIMQILNQTNSIDEFIKAIFY